MPSTFDKFTWEIFHTIFDYLKTIDLLYAFVKINPYVNTILHSYPRIQLNFKSMKKSTFYFICEHIHPNQIQSLVLSDDEYTPGQIKLFMSLLPLIQFNNLQHISIDQIADGNLLCLMLSHLENNVRIHSLSVNSELIDINIKNARSITDILTTLPSLKYLSFIDSSLLITLRQPLSKVTHLTIYSCLFNDLRIIFRWIPNLRYLKISVPFHDDILTSDHVLPHLSSLIIKSQSSMLFNQLENFLSFTPSLKHLTLETMGEQAMLDGRRWEMLIKTKLPYLTEFALNITPEENDMTADGVLSHFQNSFWTIDKHWQMACLISTMTQTCVQLFSVPQFSPTDSWYPPEEGFINHSLNHYLFHEDCTHLRVSHFPSEILAPLFFKHIRILSLECTTDNIDQIQKIVDLFSVKHLKFGSSVRCRPFNDLLKYAPNIYQLTMDRKTLVQIIDSPPDDQKVYEQIKKLNVEDTILNKDIDQICQIFPKLEHVSLSVKEREDIFPIFNGLHYLTSAIVSWTHPFNTSPSIIDEYLNQNSICTDGTYRFHASSLHVWID
ncbi:unnamed protein product [Rotaria sp. Silwood2]|nr:unnamed protein product [Rotaria sp. Silwood2]